MSELKYYKLSGKFNFTKYTFYFLISVVASYLTGLLYLKFSEIVHYIIFDKVLSIDIQLESFSDKLGFIISKLLSNNGKAGLIVLILMSFFAILLVVLYFLPFFITIISLIAISDYLRTLAESRNRKLDTIIFLVLFFICFFVSQSYKVDTFYDYIELFLFLIISVLLSNGTTNYFCEKCSKTYKWKKFYLTSELNSDDILENVNKEGIDEEERFDEKEILEKEDVKNLYYVELNKCDTCGSQIVKIESKIIELDSDGKKKIKEDKIIAENLIIS